MIQEERNASSKKKGISKQSLLIWITLLSWAAKASYIPSTNASVQSLKSGIPVYTLQEILESNEMHSVQVFHWFVW